MALLFWLQTLCSHGVRISERVLSHTPSILSHLLYIPCRASFGLRSNLDYQMLSSEDTLLHAILVSHFLVAVCRTLHDKGIRAENKDQVDPQSSH
eukprot:s2061_g3.t1